MNTATTTTASTTAQGRRFAQAIREVSRRVNAGQELGAWAARLDRAMERAIDTTVTVNRGYRYRELALAGYGEVAVRALSTS